MRVAIIQPNYISWRGYFDFFKQVDTFILYDDVQYTRRDWRNRNIIKTPDGPQWLTVPVDDSNRSALINEIKIKDNGWQERHLKQIRQAYSNAPYLHEVMGILEESFEEERESLSILNERLIRNILEYLGIRVNVINSSDIGYACMRSTERLVALCKAEGATAYLSGEAARNYLKPEEFGDIRVLWHKYKEKVYPQLWGDFLSRVSIIDTLMCCGRKTADII